MLETIKDLEKFLAPYTKLRKAAYKKKAGKKEYAAYKDYLVTNLVLPEFYTFKNREPEVVINIVSKTEIVLLDDVNGNRKFTNVVEAYDYARQDLKATVIFTGDTEAVTGKKRRGKTLAVPHEDGRGGGRLLISHTHDDDVWIAKETYLEFLYIALDYLKDPKDFVKAWVFVDSHPMGWGRGQGDSHFWATDGSAGKVWIYPNRNEKGKVRFMLEHGSQVEPERTSRYHDLRLDVYSDSYEEGFVKLAKKVNKFFYFDGSEKPDVKYKKSDLENRLDTAMADLKESEAPSGSESEKEDG